MYLVYTTSCSDLTNIKTFMYLTKREPYLILETIESLTDELLCQSADVVVFDYRQDLSAVEALERFKDMLLSLHVMVATEDIGKMYLNLTESIYVLPKAVNLMMYLWEHPAFALGNVLTASEAKENICSIDHMKSMGVSSTGVAIDMHIKDVGEEDLIQLSLHVNTEDDVSTEQISPVVEEVAIPEPTKDIVEPTSLFEDTVEPTSPSEDTVEPTSLFEDTVEPTTLFEDTVEPTSLFEDTVEPTKVDKSIPIGQEVAIAILEDVSSLQVSDKTPVEQSETIEKPAPAPVDKPTIDISTTKPTKSKEALTPKSSRNHKTPKKSIASSTPIINTAVDENTGNRKSSLTGLRRRKQTAYKSAYDYILHKDWVDQIVLNQINEEYESAKHRGSYASLYLRLYKKNLLTDEQVVTFLREYRRLAVLTYEEVLVYPLVFKTWSREVCSELRFLQLQGKDDTELFVISVESDQNIIEINNHFNNATILYCLDKVITRRLGVK